jgi:hypothetical protein
LSGVNEFHPEHNFEADHHARFADHSDCFRVSPLYF